MTTCGLEGQITQPIYLNSIKEGVVYETLYRRLSLPISSA
jgi:hypothetical protein